MFLILMISSLFGDSLQPLKG